MSWIKKPESQEVSKVHRQSDSGNQETKRAKSTSKPSKGQRRSRSVFTRCSLEIQKSLAAQTLPAHLPCLIYMGLTQLKEAAS